MNKSYSIQIESIEEIEYIQNISVYCICNTHTSRGQGSGRRCTRHDNERFPTVSREIESHRNERDCLVLPISTRCIFFLV